MKTEIQTLVGRGSRKKERKNWTASLPNKTEPVTNSSYSFEIKTNNFQFYKSLESDDKTYSIK